MSPASTGFKGPTIFICYRRISVIANIENKEILFKEPRMASVIGGSPQLAGPLERDSTVLQYRIPIERILLIVEKEGDEGSKI